MEHSGKEAHRRIKCVYKQTQIPYGGKTFIDKIITFLIVSKAATFCKFERLEDNITLQIVTKGLHNKKLCKGLLA